MRKLPLLLMVPMLTSACVRRAVIARPDSLPQEPSAGKVGVSAHADRDGRSWSMGDNQGDCQLPCARLVDEFEPLRFESSAGEIITVNPLMYELPGARRVVAVPEGPNRAKRVNGIVFTTLGGMGDVVAITLTAVGCSNVQRRGGMCTAGLITGAVAVPLTAIFIWMLVDSAPTVHLLPVEIGLTPTGLAGTF